MTRLQPRRCAASRRWPCRRSSCSPPSRCTCWSTPPWSATSAASRSPRSPSAAACSPSPPGSARVLAYGTTGRAARRFGAGDRAAAVAEGVQASWLALAAGRAHRRRRAGRRRSARARAGRRRRRTSPTPRPSWLRIAALGAPGLLLATAGNGWMRGVQDTRRPLYYVLGANVLSAVLCPLLVYPAGLGLVGSAIANVVAQTLSGALFVRALVARAGAAAAPTRRCCGSRSSLGRDLLLRGAAFQGSLPVRDRGGRPLRRGRGRRAPDRAAAVDVLRAGAGRGGHRRAVAGRRGTRRRAGRRGPRGWPGGSPLVGDRDRRRLRGA